MGWDLPVDEFFPDRKKLLLAKGDREMSLPELSDKVAEIRAQGKPRVEWGRFAVEWHKKFAIPAACLVFGLLGLALSLGSKKEARSSAFALSIGVIFVYYILIRLGEQAGDTGAMQPWIAMWGANLVLGAAGAGAAAPQPPRGGLRSPRPVALHALPARDPAPSRAAGGGGRALRASGGDPAGGGGPDPEAQPALPLAARPLHRAGLGSATSRW